MATIYPLSEGEFTIGHEKIFIPFDSNKDVLTERATGSLLVEVQPFLVKLKNDLILFDTGLGFNDASGSLQIHENIRKAGFQSEQITKVLLSHLHKDHAGGVSYKDDKGVIKPTFPNATYFIYRNEANYALEKGKPSYIPEEFESLLSSGQVSWLEGEEDNITEEISFRHSGGHCPDHIVFLVKEDDERIFFGGDEAPQLKQMKIKYVAKYDYDGKKAMRLREQYAEEGKKNNWQFLFYHDVKKPVSKL